MNKEQIILKLKLTANKMALWFIKEFINLYYNEANPANLELTYMSS